MRAICFFVCFGLFSTLAQSATYDVGPDQKLTSISAVPWANLKAGDTVRIHWRAEPYKEKWVICRAGTTEAPITVSGVRGPKGELPVIDGNNAVTVAGLDYWGEDRSILKIGGASIPKDCMPVNIVIDGIEFTGARPPFVFQGRKKPGPYAAHASAIWVEKGDMITIRNCIIRDSANGLFVGGKSKNILVEHCNIADNGLEKSGYQHNVYTEANGIVFQYNHFGPLRAGCIGNNLKDRSAGLIVRHNWIEGGNRELDLVDAEDSAEIRSSPDYGGALVYGNVFVKLPEDGHDQVIHFGGDSAHTEWYRKGVLQFFNNTVFSKRSKSTTLFWLSSDEQQVVARNNIFYTVADGKTLGILKDAGKVELTSNWLKTGWVGGAQVSEKNNFTGDAPGFLKTDGSDLHLAPDSPCKGKAVPLDSVLGLPKNGFPADLGAYGLKE
jgi:hypothetical protein